MQPAGRTRVRRRDQRRAWRGTPGGRRATHRTETAYGRGQERRDWLARWAAAQASLPRYQIDYDYADQEAT
jgi:hypothetical protein